MYSPLNTPIFGSIIVPVAGVDIALNTLLEISWQILLPYTIFGVALMIYSQTRLMIGEHQIKNEDLLKDK